MGETRGRPERSRESAADSDEDPHPPNSSPHECPSSDPRGQAELGDVLDRVSDGIIAIDRNGRYVYANRRAAALFGRTPEDLIGKEIWTEIPESLGFRAEAEKAMADQNPVQIEDYHPADHRWFEKRIYPSPDGVSIFFREITKRKRAQETLRENAALIHGQNRILESIARGEPLDLTLDPLMRLIESQSPDVLCSILMLDRDGVHARYIAAPSLPESFVRAVHGLPIVPRTGSSGTAAYRKEPVVVEDIATDPLWVEYRDLALAHGLRACWSTPIVDELGRVLGMFALYLRRPARPSPRHLELIELATHTAAIAMAKLHDIDERKRVEDDTRASEKRAVELLEQHVAARTAELHAKNRELEDEIGERRRMAALLQRKNDELKAFAYTVSHDLKAPLRGIAGYAHELERNHWQVLDERARFCVKQILMAARGLDRLIEDLLQYSRLDAETPTRADVDLGKMIDNILDDRRQVIVEHAVQVEVAVSVSTVRAWQHGLLQVLTNLVDNALKYSRLASPPKIRITSEPRPGVVRIAVSDNGIGFDMRYHARIFGLFNRLVRQEAFEGTGAGLAIVKKVVDKMDGRVWAESAPGAGATFFVEIPDAAADLT
jgi:PAS domain S-box-containing protein